MIYTGICIDNDGSRFLHIGKEYVLIEQSREVDPKGDFYSVGGYVSGDYYRKRFDQIKPITANISKDII